MKMVYGLRATTYAGKLKELGLTTSAARREHADIIQVWKHVHGQNPGGKDLFKMASEQHMRSSRHTSKPWNICNAVSKLEVRKNFFTPRSIKIWNMLPHAVQDAGDLNSFKNKYDQHFIKTASSSL